jgi:ATP-dependent DNA helicase DinG
VTAAADAAQVRMLLAAAVEAVGGSERPGQVRMAEAVAEAMREGEHLLVQAGTGTGKSLAYLVPALLHAETVVVATATIALQNQVVDRDLPGLVDAVEPLLGRRPTYAILKGRSNSCANKVFGGMPDDSTTRSSTRPRLPSSGGTCATALVGRRRRPATATARSQRHGPRVAAGERHREGAWARPGARGSRASPSWPGRGRRNPGRRHQPRAARHLALRLSRPAGTAWSSSTRRGLVDRSPAPVDD